MKTVLTCRRLILATAVAASAYCAVAADGPPRPKPSRPRPLLQDSFETVTTANRPEGWYYVRQAAVADDPHAPEGGRIVTFRNEVPGRDSQAQQSLAIDGGSIDALEVSIWVQADKVQPGQFLQQRPQVAIVFYDRERKFLGQETVGPWFGTFAWKQERAVVAVPARAELAVVGIGLMGATGQCALDDLRIVRAKRNRSVLP